MLTSSLTPPAPIEARISSPSLSATLSDTATLISSMGQAGAGPRGAKGDTGAKGNPGANSTVPGPQGPPGPQGLIGKAGSQLLGSYATAINLPPPGNFLPGDFAIVVDTGEIFQITPE